jgi:uncharacterized protein YjbI with pentapeptide repeats
MNSLFKYKIRLKKVNLSNAKVNGQNYHGWATFEDDLDAHSVQVGGPLYTWSQGQNKATFKGVLLRRAKIANQIDMHGATFEGDLNAEDLQVVGPLLMGSEEQNLTSCFAGRIVMDGAIFGGGLTAQSLRVVGDVSMRNVYTDALLAMSFAQFGGNLDIGGANLVSLDLRGASIVGEMRLGGKASMVGWVAPRGGMDFIDFRNAHVGSLAAGEYSWPKHLFLDGFTFGRFGGYEGDSGGQMIALGADWWNRNFAERDDFNSSPYEQLAAVFTGAGDHDAADDIHYDEQVRATEKSSVLGRAGSTLMRWGAGYGIGSYMFRAFYWAIALSLLGALILRLWVKGVADRNRSFLWCFGASVNKLLPGVNLKKEFVDFFDDPAHNKFTPRQDFFFVVFHLGGC